MTVAISRPALIAALALLASSAPALAATPVAKAPLAAAQISRPAAFFEAQRSAVENANSTVGADFIERWFGDQALQEAKSPMIEGVDESGPFAIEFVKEGAAWKKVKSRPASERSPARALPRASAPVPAAQGFSPASQSARLAPGVVIQAPKSRP